MFSRRKKQTFIFFFVITVLYLLAVTTECHAGQAKDHVNKSNTSPERRDICAKIQERYDDKTLKDIQVGSYPKNTHESFFADFDNDGIDEEFKYFETRTYPTLQEIVNGERRGFISSGVQSASYRGNSILKVDEEFFVLHIATYGPLTLQRVTEITPEEMKRRNMNPDVRSPVYDTQILCNF